MDKVYLDLAASYATLVSQPPDTLDQDELHNILSISTSLCSLAQSLVESTYTCPGAFWRNKDEEVQQALHEYNNDASRRIRQKLAIIGCNSDNPVYTRNARYEGVLICDACNQTLGRDTKRGIVKKQKDAKGGGAFTF